MIVAVVAAVLLLLWAAAVLAALALAAALLAWAAALRTGEPVHINGDGETSRDFCYIDNVVQANLLAANPAQPAVMGTLLIPGDAQRIVVVGNTAYIAAGSGGLRIVNVSNPANPIEVGHYSPTDNWASRVTVNGNYAYVLVAGNRSAGAGHGHSHSQVDERGTGHVFGRLGTDRVPHHHPWPARHRPFSPGLPRRRDGRPARVVSRPHPA